MMSRIAGQIDLCQLNIDVLSSFTVTGQQLHRQLGQILAAPVLRGEDDPLELVRAAHEVQERAEVLMAAAVEERERRAEPGRKSRCSVYRVRLFSSVTAS